MQKCDLAQKEQYGGWGIPLMLHVYICLQSCFGNLRGLTGAAVYIEVRGGLKLQLQSTHKCCPSSSE